MISIGGTQILTQDKSAIVKIFTFGELGWYTAGKKCASCYEVGSIWKYEKNSNYNVSGIG